MSSPILVLGAGSNVGREVVKQLLVRGSTLRAADRSTENLIQSATSSVEAVPFDFSKPETFTRAFAGIEKMYLMRPPQISDVKRYMFPAIDAARQAGVKKVVFLSLIGIENTKYVPHYKVEQYLKQSDFQTIFLRCSFFMQNLNTTHRMEIKERNEIFVPVGTAKTSFIDVRDIGAVAAEILSRDDTISKNYDLTGSEALDYIQITKILSEVLGREIKYKNPNLIYFLIEILRRGTPFMFAVVMAGLYTSTRLGMAETVTNEVENLLGRKPITFREYARDYKESWI
jgi:uncharacterized protein YbjT (DUF2867 family)